VFAILYPTIDPVALQVGPVAIRWYALAYLFGLLLGWRYANWLARRPPGVVPPVAVDDFLVWATLGVVLGGRIGYVLIVRPEYFLAHPLAAFQIWKGGMAFHGGLVGVVIAGWLFCCNRKLPKAAFADLIFCAAPIGLGLGRIANFINAELAGRVTDVPWAVLFPDPPWGPLPRHPSQLYEAALEGVALFVLLFLLARREAVRRRYGLLSGVFLIGYGAARSFVELFREIDPAIGPLGAGLTMGQVLSLPMIAVGGVLVVRALNRPPGP
jgi:phosphatidylglycerol:prolipoprotein diacylglycerol transferase